MTSPYFVLFTDLAAPAESHLNACVVSCLLAAVHAVASFDKGHPMPTVLELYNEAEKLKDEDKNEEAIESAKRSTSFMPGEAGSVSIGAGMTAIFAGRAWF